MALYIEAWEEQCADYHDQVFNCPDCARRWAFYGAPDKVVVWDFDMLGSMVS